MAAILDAKDGRHFENNRFPDVRFWGAFNMLFMMLNIL